MKSISAVVVACLLPLGAGCGGGATASSLTCSVDVSDPSVPGAHIHIEGPDCRVQSAQHHLFSYRIDLDADVPYLSQASIGCGRCRGFTENPMSLVKATVGATTATGAISYCPDCLEGCCPATVSMPVVLRAGSYVGEIDWPGYQWLGPSDTSEPPGPKFPPGKYAVNVLLDVPSVGAIDAKLPIVVFDPSATNQATCRTRGYVYPSGSSLGLTYPAECQSCRCTNGTVTGCPAATCAPSP